MYVPPAPPNEIFTFPPSAWYALMSETWLGIVVPRAQPPLDTANARVTPLRPVFACMSTSDVNG
ncbi:hypothetical protein D3C83_277230 [compost metagenome]